jgi:hypothetical protein
MNRRIITLPFLIIATFIYYYRESFINFISRGPNALLAISMIIFAVAVGTLALLALYYNLSKEAVVSKNLKKIAQELGGNIKKSFLAGLPTLTFQFKGRYCSIKLYRSRYEHYLRFACSVRSDFEIQISKPFLKQKWMSSLTKPIGREEISTGDPEFDRKYSIHGKDENHAREFLGGINNRMELEALFKHFYSFSIKNGVVELKTTGPYEIVTSPQKSKEIFSGIAKLIDYIEEKRLGNEAA